MVPRFQTTALRRLAPVAVSAISLLAGCAGSDPEAQNIDLRPGSLGCPHCEVKIGTYTVPRYPELATGYAITSAVLLHRVDYRSHCPAPPTNEDPPCQRADTLDVMPAAAEQTYARELIFATDPARGDTQEATATLTLTKSGAQTLSRALTVDISSRE